MGCIVADMGRKTAIQRTRGRLGEVNTRNVRTETPPLDYQALMKRAVDILAKKLAEDFTTADLAMEVGYSTFHFHRLFAAMAGETVGEMRRRLRLERAAHRVAVSEVSISEIGIEEGYATPQAFATAFRNYFGETPTEARGRGWVKIPPRPNGVFWGSQGLVKEFIRVRPMELDMQVEIKEIAPIHAVALRHIGPYHEIGATFGKLWGMAMSQGVPPGQGIAAYYDDPESTPPNELRSDAAITVPPDFAGTPEGLTRIQIDGGKYAVARYVGPYSGLGEAWKWVYGEWLPQSGLTPAPKVCFELYINHDEQHPENCVTEVCVPIE